MNYCKVCGRKLELTPEYDMCIDCQGKQHRTFTLSYIAGVNANHTEMTAKEALEILTKQLNLAINGSKVNFEIANESRNIITQALSELETIKSAENGEAMEELEMLREYYDEDGEDEATCDSWSIVNNYILKSQAQERELRELKEKVRNLAGNHILSKIEEVFGENNSLVNKIDELLNLCKGSEE